MQPRLNIFGKVTNTPTVSQSQNNTQYLILKIETQSSFTGNNGNEMTYIHNYDVMFGDKKFAEVERNIRQGDHVFVEASLLSKKKPGNNGQEFINLSLSGISCELVNRPVTMGQKLNNAMDKAREVFTQPAPPAQQEYSHDDIPF